MKKHIIKNLKKNKIKYIVLAGLLLSVLLNILIPIYFQNQIASKNKEINNVNYQIKELNNNIDSLNEKLKNKSIDEENYKKQIENLNNEKIELNKKLNAKLESKKKIPNFIVYATNGNCIDWIKKAGIDEVDSAYKLIMKESGCNVNSINKYSGACGIPQALPCSKLGVARGNPVEEIKWMKNYVYRRYGSFNNALNFHYRNNWY